MCHYRALAVHSPDTVNGQVHLSNIRFASGMSAMSMDPLSQSTPYKSTLSQLASPKEHVSAEPVTCSTASSPLTSLASEDELGEDLSQELRETFMSRRQKRDLYVSLRESGGLAEQVDYPAVGDRFDTTENFQRACYLASWSHGHSMVRIPFLMSRRRVISLTGVEFLLVF